MFKKTYQKALASIMTGLTAGSLALAKPNFVNAQEKPNKLENVLKNVHASPFLNFDSKYTSASGKILLDNPITVPGVNIKAGDLSALILGVYDTKNKEFVEGDYIFGFGREIKDFGRAEIGYGYYSLPSSQDTHELIAKLGLKLPLNPELRVYRDLHLTRGLFASLNIGQEVKLGDIPLVLGGSLGYNRNYTVDGSGFSNASGYIGIPFKPAKGVNFTVTPNLTINKALGKKFDDFIRLGVEFRF
ncbi:hypothetical protein HYX17_05355 [Candidatus Woesearchaeota archaeon]|nr:hypothetical protein [Candidatus Woesearchaeota archaeon]